MSQPSVLFSSHFTPSSRNLEWDSEIVGRKASGLDSLPAVWTPPFAVLTGLSPLDGRFEKSLQLVDVAFVRDNFAPLLALRPRRLIVRSSASAEHIECRGWLESKQTDPSPEQVARVVSDVFFHDLRLVADGKDTSSSLALIVQEFKTPRL